MSFGHFCCTEEVFNISTVSGHRVMEQCDLRLSVFCQSKVLTVFGGWGIKSKEMAFYSTFFVEPRVKSST